MATVNRQNSDIIKGGQLMVFLDNEPIAFATTHTLNLTRNTQEITTKDHGDFTAVLGTNISWEMTSENLMSEDGYKAVLNAFMSGTEVTCYFGLTTYDGYPDQEDGIVGATAATDWASQSWPGATGSTDVSKFLNLSGKGIVTSAQVNAPAGENATMSITIQGTSKLERGA